MTTAKNYLLLFTMLIAGLANAQEHSKQPKTHQKIGISAAAFGESTFVYFVQLDGAGSTDIDHFVSLGFDYFKPIKKAIYFETGLDFAYQKATVVPMLPPTMDVVLQPETFLLFHVPIYLHAEILDFLFFNGGALIDIDPSSGKRYDNQTGIGLGLGMGIQRTFKSGVGIYFSPYMKMHGVLPIAGEKYPQRYFENAIKLGFTYQLN